MRSDLNVAVIEELIGTSPNLSTRRVANELGISHSSIRREMRAVPMEMVRRSILRGYPARLRECVARGGRQVETY